MDGILVVALVRVLIEFGRTVATTADHYGSQGEKRKSSSHS
jgi:hypothetical protein